MEEEERQSQSKKQAKLDKLEQQWKSEQQKAGGGWWFWSPFTVSFPSNVIANLQVNFDLSLNSHMISTIPIQAINGP